MTVHDAARALGVSEDAVRMRVKRGKLPSDKEDGRLYVLLDTEPTSDPTGAGLASELIEELRSRVSYLEGIISTRDEEIRRRDVIISQLTERIPAIEAPQEARKSPETVENEGDRAEPYSATGGAQETAQRPWWRRVFGS